jgi:hypothetical protein
MAASVLDRFVIHPSDPLTEVCSQRLRDRLDEIVAWLAERMPDPVRVPPDLRVNGRSEARDMLWYGKGEAHEAARADRAEALSEHHARGATVPELMVEFGLSRRRVYELLEVVGRGSVASGPAA